MQISFMHEGIYAWENMAPSLIFAVFIPPIIFQSGLTLEWHVVKRQWTDAVWLAVVGTGFNAVRLGTC
jgi:NhaP-type Na+/H+ or K+/H+ antiporter